LKVVVRDLLFYREGQRSQLRHIRKMESSLNRLNPMMLNLSEWKNRKQTRLVPPCAADGKAVLFTRSGIGGLIVAHARRCHVTGLSTIPAKRSLMKTLFWLMKNCPTHLANSPPHQVVAIRWRFFGFIGTRRTNSTSR
jgi:hypothetical protein